MIRATLALVLAVSLVGAGCSGGGAQRDEAGRITASGKIRALDLEVGDCAALDEDVEAEVESVEVTPCSEPHELEVYAVADYEEAGTYPGPDELTSFAESACASRFADYVGVDYLDSDLYFTYLYPTLRSWDEADDRAVVCFATTTGQQITGSVRGTGR